jgi:hypothetical protein
VARRIRGNGWPGARAARSRRRNGWPTTHKGASAAPSSFRKVQLQAGVVLARLRRDIRAMETELARLKHDEDLWSRLAGRGGAGGGVAREPRAAGGGGSRGTRINWRNVLTQLPKQFKASNVRQVRGLKDKRPSEIFAAITRWSEAGLVKRRTRGLYQKTWAPHMHARSLIHRWDT